MVELISACTNPIPLFVRASLALDTPNQGQGDTLPR
jgi:hypothetical protein